MDYESDPIGSIKKVRLSCCKEFCTNNDTFVINCLYIVSFLNINKNLSSNILVPPNTPVNRKAIIFGSSFLLVNKFHLKKLQKF